MDNEQANRHFCSNLVSVHLPARYGEAREVVGNLEEIYTSGAYLNLEEPLVAHVPLRLVCSDVHGTCEFLAEVVDCNHNPATGYLIHVEFRHGFSWSPEVYTPKHLIRASSVLSRHSELVAPEVSCCDRGVCHKEVIASLLDPDLPLAARVRTVAKEVAVLCGTLTESEAASCFGNLFGAGPECRLFTEFLDAYIDERRSGPRQRQKTLRNQVETLVRLAGEVPTRAAKSDSCGPSAAPLNPPKSSL